MKTVWTITMSNCRLKAASTTFKFFQHGLTWVIVPYCKYLHRKWVQSRFFSNNLLTKDQIKVKVYTTYLFWYIFTYVNLTDLNFCHQTWVTALDFAFWGEKINKICDMNASIAPKYWTNIELPYNLIFRWLLQLLYNVCLQLFEPFLTLSLRQNL